MKKSLPTFVPGWEFLPLAPGVYRLYMGDVCIYVGSSTVLRTRVKSHNLRDECNGVRWVGCPVWDLVQMEQETIEAFRPTHNKSHAYRFTTRLVTPLVAARWTTGLSTLDAAMRCGVEPAFYNRLESYGEGSARDAAKIAEFFKGKITVRQILRPIKINATIPSFAKFLPNNHNEAP